VALLESGNQKREQGSRGAECVRSNRCRQIRLQGFFCMPFYSVGDTPRMSTLWKSVVQIRTLGTHEHCKSLPRPSPESAAEEGYGLRVKNSSALSLLLKESIKLQPFLFNAKLLVVNFRRESSSAHLSYGYRHLAWQRTNGANILPIGIIQSRRLRG